MSKCIKYRIPLKIDESSFILTIGQDVNRNGAKCLKISEK